MSSGLVSILPCLSLILSSVVFSVFLKMTLCILLGCRFKVFMYFEIAFLQVIEVCFVMMSLAFFLAFFPKVPSVFIHSLINVGSFGGLGIVVWGWFCRLVSILGLLLFGVGRCFFYMMLFGGISRHIG
jgi:hypothetical protein